MSPALLLGTLLCIAYASLFHLWRGRSVNDLALYLAASAVGFVLGQSFGALFNIPLFQMGDLHLFVATVGAWLALFATQFLRPIA
ncbi:MAG: hypothetical protein KDD78_04205 [Caldilineaceae bacterium]|nr:hypothetical protein [Caldilineaceae bacterium]